MNLSDDELQRRLTRLIADDDPVPSAVVQAGHQAFGWRRLEAELAELLADSALEPSLPALARGEEASLRAVTFGVGRRTIDIEISALREGGGGPPARAVGEGQAVRRLRGQLSPAAEVTIEVQRADGAPAAETRADALGRFLVEVSAPGAIRLRLSGTPDHAPIETAWFTL